MGKSGSVETDEAGERGVMVGRRAAAAAAAEAEGEGALRLEPRSFAASEVGPTVDGGRPESLVVRPTVTCAWAGLDRPPAEVGATLLANLPAEGGGFDPVATEVLPLDARGRAGEKRVAFGSARCLLANTSLAPVDFAVLGAGEGPRERVVRLRLCVHLLDEEGLPTEGDAVTGDWMVVVSGDEGSATFLDR